MGADGYITKPVTPKALVGRMKAILASMVSLVNLDKTGPSTGSG